jgi:hypothetical protein
MKVASYVRMKVGKEWMLQEEVAGVELNVQVLRRSR